VLCAVEGDDDARRRRRQRRHYHRRAAPPLSLAGAIVTVAQRLAGDGYKGEGCRRQRRDLATRQEACNPNCAIVHEALAGNSSLSGSAVSSLLCFPGE